MTYFNPALPPCVSGKGYRLSLDHPEIEAIGARMDRLYSTVLLPTDYRTELLKLYKSLALADRFFIRVVGEAALPATVLRPKILDESRLPGSPCCGEPDFMVRAGYVFRIKEYVERLERIFLGVGADADAI